MTMTKKPSLVAVVPFRSVSGGKERLVTVLSDAERSELSARLLERTLRALLGASSVDSVLLVSPDPLARALARGYGAEALDDDGVPLNAAIERGLRAAEAAGARTAVVIPVDLAAIDAAAIEALIAEWRSRNTATQPGILAAIFEVPAVARLAHQVHAVHRGAGTDAIRERALRTRYRGQRQGAQQ